MKNKISLKILEVTSFVTQITKKQKLRGGSNQQNANVTAPVSEAPTCIISAANGSIETAQTGDILCPTNINPPTIVVDTGEIGNTGGTG